MAVQQVVIIAARSGHHWVPTDIQRSAAQSAVLGGHCTGPEIRSHLNRRSHAQSLQFSNFTAACVFTGGAPGGLEGPAAEFGGGAFAAAA